MVELKLEAVDFKSDVSIPKDTYVAIRVGESQKLSRLTHSRDFKFSEAVVGDRRFGKIDIFKRVGTASISIKADSKMEVEEVDVPCREGEKMKFRVFLGSKTMQEKPPSKETSNSVSEAKNYLAEHNLEMRLAEAMQACLREKPADPANFIAGKLKENQGVNRKIAPKLDSKVDSSAVVPSKEKSEMTPSPPPPQDFSPSPPPKQDFTPPPPPEPTQTPLTVEANPKPDSGLESAKDELKANLLNIDARSEDLCAKLRTGLSAAATNGTLQENVATLEAKPKTDSGLESAKDELAANTGLSEAVANGTLQENVGTVEATPQTDSGLESAKDELKANTGLSEIGANDTLQENAATVEATPQTNSDLESAKDDLKANLLNIDARSEDLKAQVRKSLSEADANGTIQENAAVEATPQTDSGLERAKDELKANLLNIDARIEDLKATLRIGLSEAVANGTLPIKVDELLPRAM